MKDDVLWMGEIEAVVNEVGPIRGLIKVTLATNVQLDVGPCLLYTSPSPRD